jgi:23S rRNA pseudouridine1911/1915/1917 synthase
MPSDFQDPHIAPPFPVLYEDNHLLVISKPALLPTMGVQPDRPSAVSLVKEYLKQKYRKPGNVYLGVVSRLDSMVSGVLPLARTSKCASRLSQQFRERAPNKTYLAITPQTGNLKRGKLIDWVIKDESQHRMQTTSQPTPGSQRAELELLERQEIGKFCLWKISLLTGRKHQIRVQLASRGAPIVGDRKYGSRLSFPAGIGLHAANLTLTHPTTGERLEFTAPQPLSWRSYLG